MLPFEQLTSALVSLVIGTLLGSEITRWLYRPRVHIRYEDVAPLVTEDGLHWTIRVVNLGRTVAQDCKGIITIDDLQPEDLLHANQANGAEVLPTYKEEHLDLSFPRDQLINPTRFRQIVRECLAWAGLGNPSSISINPGITEMLDVFKIQAPDKGGYIIVPTERGWRRLRTRIKPKNLTGRIMVCPSNDFPTLILFRLSFDGAGNSTFSVEGPPLTRRLMRILSRERYYFG